MKAAARGWMLRVLFRTNNIWLPTALAEIQELTESARAYAYQWLRGYHEVLAALEYLSYRSHQDDIDPDLIVKALATDSLLMSATYNTMAIHGLENLLNKLEISGVAPAKLAALEWRYFQLLQHFRQPRAFFAWLRKHPEQFVEVVGLMFRAASDTPRSEDDPEETVDCAAARRRASGTLPSVGRMYVLTIH